MYPLHIAALTKVHSGSDSLIACFVNMTHAISNTMKFARFVCRLEID